MNKNSSICGNLLFRRYCRRKSWGWLKWVPTSICLKSGFAIADFPPSPHDDFCWAWKLTRRKNRLKHRPMRFLVGQAENWKTAADLDYRYLMPRWANYRVIAFRAIEWEMRIMRNDLKKEKTMNFFFLLKNLMTSYMSAWKLLSTIKWKAWLIWESKWPAKKRNWWK